MHGHYHPERKIAPQKLKSDAVLLKKILEANHPSLYWYTPKDSIDYYFNQIINGSSDSLTELQFKNKIAWAISKIRCGHTSVRPSNQYFKYITIHRQKQFPLGIKAWKDTLVVLGSLKRNDTIFKRGTIITSINGISNRLLLDSMYQFISTDGYADNFKSQAVSLSFPSSYKNAFGLSNTYTINYIDTSGNEQTALIHNYDPAADTLAKNLSEQNVVQPSKKEIRVFKKLSKRSLALDTATSTAYMRVATFTGGNLRPFFRSSFQRLKANQIQNLVIDLRENSGGNIGPSINFMRYLSVAPFRMADTVAAISRSFPYGRYIRLSLVYRIFMRLTTRKKCDEKFHFTALERHYFQPKTSLHFNGDIYIIQGGFTFSAGAMFVSHLKGQQNVTVVGEETGGGYYGNSAVHLPSIILPNTHVNIVLPVYRVVNDSTRTKTGRGIMPDVYVEPSSAAIKNGTDIKLEKIKQMIAEKRKRE